MRDLKKNVDDLPDEVKKFGHTREGQLQLHSHLGDVMLLIISGTILSLFDFSLSLKGKMDTISNNKMATKIWFRLTCQVVLFVISNRPWVSYLHFLLAL